MNTCTSDLFRHWVDIIIMLPVLKGIIVCTFVDNTSIDRPQFLSWEVFFVYQSGQQELQNHRSNHSLIYLLIYLPSIIESFSRCFQIFWRLSFNAYQAYTLTFQIELFSSLFMVILLVVFSQTWYCYCYVNASILKWRIFGTGLLHRQQRPPYFKESWFKKVSGFVNKI